MSNTATRLAIAIDLDALEQLMQEYIAEASPESLSDWRMTTFLVWLRKRQQQAMKGGDGNEREAKV